MKRVTLIIVSIVLASASAMAWPSCSGNWVQVPSGTTSAGGALYTTGDHITFQCQPVTPPSDPSKPTNVTSTSAANSASNSNSAANSTSGAASTATGGNVSNSGNSNVSVRNNLNQKQQQQQSQQQSQSNLSSNSNQSQGGNVSDVGNSSETTNIPRQAPPAFAPTILPSNCQGTLSGAASSPVGGIALGGSRADKNCQSLAVAAAFAQMRNFTAAAKVLCNTRAAREAKLTLDDCLLVEAQIVASVAPPATLRTADIKPTVVIEQAPPQIILLEQPVTVEPTKEQLAELKPHVVKAKPHVIKHKPCPVTPIQQQCPVAAQEK